MNLDGWVVDYFAQNPPPYFLTQIGLILKRLGEGDDLAFLCVLFGIYAYLKRDGKAMRSSAIGILATALSGPVVQAFKHLFGRARPLLNLGDFHFIGPNLAANGFDSFPSGHALASFALAAFFSRYYPKGKFYFYAFAAAISLVGRVMLREHFLSDVVVGGALGIALGSFIAKKFEPWIQSGQESPSGSKILVSETFERPLRAIESHWKSLALVTLFSGVTLLTGLNRSALWDRDETEYAQATIEMRQGNDWLIPTLEGEPFIEKPILLYWVTRASAKVFGDSETGYRFPSALLGILCCWITYFIAQTLWGGGAGFKASMALASSILFAGCFNLLMTDPLFVTFSMLSLLFYVLSYKKEDRALLFLILSYSSVGIAALAKGPIGFFPIPVYLVFEFFHSKLSRWDFIQRNIVKCAALSLIPFIAVAPWFMYVFSREEKATSSFFLYDNLFRFLQGMEGHTGPAFYYVPVLLIGFFPWSFFFIRAAAQNWREREDHSPLRAESFLLLTWILFLFVFFSLSANKLPHYIAPVLPAMACWVGKIWDDQTARNPLNLRNTFLWTLTLSGLLLLAPFALILMKRPQYFSIALLTPFTLSFAALCAASFWSARERWQKSFNFVFVAGFLFLLSAKIWSFPWIEKFRVMKPMGTAIKKLVPQDAKLYGYFVSEPSLFIYGGRTFPKIEDVSLDALLIRPEPTYVIVPELWLKSDIPFEILEKASGFAENSGEVTLYLIKNKL